MVLWRRIGNVGFESLTRHRGRSSYIPWGSVGAPSASDAAGHGRFRASEGPLSRLSPVFSHTPVRSFAAPVHVKPKPKAKEKSGPRMNGAITDTHVRLVFEDGHRIVSREDALATARRLDLDLVEVQRKDEKTGDPSVCKLMNYHKEKYKQDVKQKERTKAKSATVLRGGESKEVRFKAKTELKDLKTKAESVKRLMERGYRVQCIAMPTGNGDEDLGGLLLSLLSLIEDVSVIESGPHIDERKAYVIVKHVKFSSKKSGKKISKAFETVSSILNARSMAAPEDSAYKDASDSKTVGELKPVDSGSETEIEAVPKPAERSTQNLYGSRPASQTRVVTPNRYLEESAKRDCLRKPPLSLQNTRAEPREEYAAGRVAVQREPHVVESNRYARGGNPRDQAARPYNPCSQSSRYGVFDASQSSHSSDRNTVPDPTINKPNVRHGVFSSVKPSAPVDQQNTDDTNRGRLASSNSSSTSSYGIFSASKPISSDGQVKQRDATSVYPSKISPPSPQYGIFSSSKVSSSGDGVADKH
ncbi:Translation initiation factor IF-3, chloroplastic [Apostasia shenzhenica]|uniref:Translation initiation factor IF-3, chloroplastic n=1 Tax=Apostasia shenzhenica TaxID=1088818 RepID=A0A2I0B440_9ASPA|nr:Translation initiation factor IF-3, chloroplastic [Apostasia shenzhenica]